MDLTLTVTGSNASTRNCLIQFLCQCLENTNFDIVCVDGGDGVEQTDSVPAKSDNSTLPVPTVGRKIWYQPGTLDLLGHGRMHQAHREPLDATIVCVNPDMTVNIVIFDTLGRMHTRLHVLIAQGGQGVDEGESYCEWMPYQIAQAEFPVARLVTDSAVKDEFLRIWERKFAGEMEKAARNDAVQHSFFPDVGCSQGVEKTVEKKSYLSFCPTEHLHRTWDLFEAPGISRNRVEVIYGGHSYVVAKSDVDAELTARGDNYGAPRSLS